MLLNEVDRRFPSYPFSLREFDEKTARAGIVEMSKVPLVRCVAGQRR
jgi:hypothetical protein